jgi:hypothetical protein
MPKCKKKKLVMKLKYLIYHTVKCNTTLSRSMITKMQYFNSHMKPTMLMECIDTKFYIKSPKFEYIVNNQLNVFVISLLSRTSKVAILMILG